jgi:hypothetical protein
VCSPPARAEQVDAALSVLKQAPYQLEVTVLGVETKKGPHQGDSLWFRVRVDRVMVGEGLNAGDETAVVSRTYTVAPGSVGTSGDRGRFAGPNGLPVKGDRARIYADGTAKVLKSVPPNGWQPVEPMVAFLAANERVGAEKSMPFLAGLVKDCGLGETRVHLATAGTGGIPQQQPKADEKAYFIEQGRLRSSGDTIVLCASGLRPDYNTALDVNEALRGGRPIVAIASELETFGFPAGTANVEKYASFDRDVLGATPKGRAAAGTWTMILPPDAEAARHPILAGVVIPDQGCLKYTGPSDASDALLSVELAPDCRVLLWGRPCKGDGIPMGEKQPILWVREIPRASNRGEPKPVLPSQRIAVTTLGSDADFASTPVVRLLAVQMIAWAGDDATRTVDEAGRAKILRTRLGGDPPAPCGNK